MNDPNKTTTEITAYVTLKLAVGLAYDVGHVPDQEQLKRDAVANFLTHPLVLSEKLLCDDLLSEATVVFEPFDDQNPSRLEKIRAIANEQYGEEGEIEFDDQVKVAEGGDNGAYVAAWVWVDFSGTPLDKCTPEGAAITPEEFRLKGGI